MIHIDDSLFMGQSGELSSKKANHNPAFFKDGTVIKIKVKEPLF